MKKIINLIVNSISWLMFITMFIYILEVIFDFENSFIDDIFSNLGLHRGRVQLFIAILLISCGVISLACLLRYLFSIKTSKK